MNQFERVAIYTTIESIEAQLRGLKTLIAASSGVAEQGKTHKVTQTMGDDGTLSEDEEQLLEKQLKKARASLANEAQDVFLETLTSVAGGIQKQTPNQPIGHEMSELNG